MAKFRKKPVVVEAFRYNGNMGEFTEDLEAVSYPAEKGGDCFIKTLEGDMRCTVGDWIINGVNGEFYPCKPDIFEKTYEPADISIPSVSLSLELYERMVRHLRWMAADIDYRNQTDNPEKCDSPEMADVKSLLEELGI